MDFFAQQQAARRRTSRLILTFILAVELTILAVYLPVRIFYQYVLAESDSTASVPPFLHPPLFFLVAVVTLGVVVTGAVYRTERLRHGGEAVARLVGGRPIEANTRDPEERQVVNVVEEIAIASGVPPPPVFLLEKERGINAFAAGWGTGDAVIGVTKGAVRLLSREELQGVVAHEFSHILSGDMRLNISLMGWLHGLLVIHLSGRKIAESARRGDGDGKGQAMAGLFGLALLIIGGLGAFFGRLIKSAVSRERELLADATAVQFTRNPLGLSGALKKIGGLPGGSRLRAPNAEEASHMYFGQGVGGGAWLATHPPLVERIRRLEPAFDGSFPKIDLPREPKPEPAAPPPAVLSPQALPIAAAKLVGVDPDAVVARAGRVYLAHVQYASSLLAALPEEVRSRVHEPAAAQAVIFALLAAAEPEVRERQLATVRAEVGPAIAERAAQLTSSLDDCPLEARLPLVDLVVPALTRLSRPQYEHFRAAVQDAVEADREMSLFEFLLGWILMRHLEMRFRKRRAGTSQYLSLRMLPHETSVLLSALAHFGTTDPHAAGRAFEQGAAQLTPEPVALELLPAELCALPAVAAALRKLTLVAPRLKERLVRAASAAIAADQRVTLQEAELLRAVCEALECPLPPFVGAA